MIEKNVRSKEEKPERAILVGVCRQGMKFEQATEYLDELAFLASTAGARAVRSFIQKLEKPVNSTYVGKGKLEEIKIALEEAEASLVIFDDDLSPSQQRNIEKALEVKILDRSTLILDIFARRAQTAQARNQVELAQYQYLLPRLTGMWTHLSRQRGGIGMRGAGEKEIETDRRIIRQRIAKLKEELEKIERQSLTRRKNRSEFVRVALVGYTNVGKSTLMNLITKSKVLAENKLFATLDTTVRKVAFYGIPFLLSDTVGFIRKLPHHLVECFKSTLAEAQESDILIHVIDASHPQFEDHISVVKQTFKELEIHQKPVLAVFNKIDQLSPEARVSIEEHWQVKEHEKAVCISAATKENLEAFRMQLTELIVETYQERSPNEKHHFLNGHSYFEYAKEEYEQLSLKSQEE